jgi:hypothetical protein
LEVREKIIRSGIDPIVAPINCSSQGGGFDPPCSDCNPTAKVYISSLGQKIKGIRNSCHMNTTWKTKTVTRIVLELGRIILAKMPTSEHPSILAASESSSGIALKN